MTSAQSASQPNKQDPVSIDYQALYGFLADPRAAHRVKQETKLEIPTGAGSRANQAVPAGRNGVIPPLECTFKTIKEQFIKTGQYWLDPDFPADYTSIDSSKPEFEKEKKISWLRPREICDNPQFIIDGATRFDVQPGFLETCPFLPVLASLSLQKDLLEKVVPRDQNFQNSYCGAFRFNFWIEGQWREIIVDDRLPSVNKRLYFVHSGTPNEFWSALLEKAYAKLKGSYVSLKQGKGIDALVDLTGGVGDSIQLNNKALDEFAPVLDYYFKHRCVITAGSRALRQGETKMENGLEASHSFSITGFAAALADNKGQKIDLVRLRNPWGSAVEWNGAWRDNAPEWNSLSDILKRELGIEFKPDGEFWMSLKDFLDNFITIEMAHLSPMDSATDEVDSDYALTMACGAFKARINAGGWIGSKSFHTNPRYLFSIGGEKDELTNVLFNVIQKGTRKAGSEIVPFSYVIYELNDDTVPLDENFFNKQRLEYKGAPCKTPMVHGRHDMKPGNYMIVPATAQADQEFEFLIRCFTRVHAKTPGSASPPQFSMTEATPANATKEVKKTVIQALPPLDDKAYLELRAVFDIAAGEDRALDALELRQILQEGLKQDFRVTKFDMRINKIPKRSHDDPPKELVEESLQNGGPDAIETKKMTTTTTKTTTKKNMIGQMFGMCTASSGQFATTSSSSKPRLSFLKKKDKVELSLETARGLLSYMDLDRSGYLEFAEFRALWDLMCLWRKVYLDHQLPDDPVERLNSDRLRGALDDVGYQVDNLVFTCIVMRYVGRNGYMSFDEFVQVCSRLKGLCELFEATRNASTDLVIFNKSQFLSSTMFL